MNDILASSSPVLAVGFCATCCIPVIESIVMRRYIDGELMFFCSDKCTTRYRTSYRVPGAHW